MIALDKNHKSCMGCKSVLPIEDFPLRSSGYRQWLCLDCGRRYGRERYYRLRKKKFDKVAQSIAREPTLNKIPLIIGRLLDGFGSLDNFCAAWLCAINESMTQNAGGTVALRHLVAIAKMIEFISNNQPAPEDMSDEELQDALTV
ncbi:MAG: hypothetical protein IT426_20780 [Pirellulales bacterium]|nr:hypothetical protein [Pirellulales bacterium]